MHLKASECPAVVVLDVSFSYPVIFAGRSLSFKLNQMSPVVMLVHVARLSQRKVLLLLRYGVVVLAMVSLFYLVLEGFGEPSGCTFGGVLPGSWADVTSFSVSPGSCFMIVLPGGGCLFEITS